MLRSLVRADLNRPSAALCRLDVCGRNVRRLWRREAPLAGAAPDDSALLLAGTWEGGHSR